MIKIILAILFVSIFLGGCLQESYQEQKQPTFDNKLQIIKYLKDTGESEQFLIGQHIGSPEWYKPEEAEGLCDKTHMYPKVISFDIHPAISGKEFDPLLFGLPEDKDVTQYDIPNMEEIRKKLAEFSENGALIALSTHPHNPATYEDAHSTLTDYKELLTTGSDLNKRWMSALDNNAYFLKELEKEGVTILWRPFHEMNGGWFWWGSDKNWPTQEEFKDMWIHMHNYYTNEKGLTNLIWVYAPSTNYWGDYKSTDHYYPGDDYVDVVGLSYYWDDTESLNNYQSYDALLKHNKPIVVAEFGPRENIDGSFDSMDAVKLKEKYPEISYVLFWNSWNGADVAIKDLKNPDRLMNHEQVITLIC